MSGSLCGRSTYKGARWNALFSVCKGLPGPNPQQRTSHVLPTHSGTLLRLSPGRTSWTQQHQAEGGFQSRGPDSEAVLPALSLLNLRSPVGKDRGERLAEFSGWDDAHRGQLSTQLAHTEGQGERKGCGVGPWAAEAERVWGAALTSRS